MLAVDIGCDEVDELGGDEETAEKEGDEEVPLDPETILLLVGIRGFPFGHSRPRSVRIIALSGSGEGSSSQRG